MLENSQHNCKQPTGLNSDVLTWMLIGAFLMLASLDHIYTNTRALL